MIKKRIHNEWIHIEIEDENRTSRGRLQWFNVVARRAKTKREVGIMEVAIEDDGYAYVCSVNIDIQVRGKGLGKALYQAAIIFYGELNTHFNEASQQAQRVWLSLISSGKYNYNWQEVYHLCLWPKGKRRKRRK